jgi:hypothetical protein
MFQEFSRVLKRESYLSRRLKVEENVIWMKKKRGKLA